MHTPIENAGFRPPAEHALGGERRTVALAELVAGVALAVATLVVATVLSIGVARADVLGGAVGHETRLLGGAVLFGLIFIGLGTTLPGRKRKPH